MTSAAVEQIVSAFVTLPPLEQQQVIGRLSSLLAESALPEDEAERRLLSQGIIDFNPAPAANGPGRGERRLVQVTGQPLSETIISERR